MNNVLLERQTDLPDLYHSPKSSFGIKGMAVQKNFFTNIYQFFYKYLPIFIILIQQQGQRNIPGNHL